MFNLRLDNHDNRITPRAHQLRYEQPTDAKSPLRGKMLVSAMHDLMNKKGVPNKNAQKTIVRMLSEAR